MTKLVIIGAGGLGRETLWVARRIGKWKWIYFIDDNKSFHGRYVNHCPVIASLSSFDQKGYAIICGIGNTKIRERISHCNLYEGNTWITLIDPSCLISSYVDIGEGTVITANNIITVDVKIGKHVFINLNCTIGHDTVMGDYVNCAPGCNISGNVKIGEGAYIGTNATIIQGVTIGKWSIVGAGSTVINDIPDNVVAVGSPAKIIKRIGR